MTTKKQHGTAVSSATVTIESSTNMCALCTTTKQADTESNPNPNPTTKQREIVNSQLNIVACPTYPDKFIRDNVVALFTPT